MLTIPHEIISSLNISPRQSIQWVKESFHIKEEEPVFLPHKTSIAFEEGKFMNTMPCIVPGLNAMGVKIVTRYPERAKTINGEILLYDYHTGELLALMDAFWVTNARTGAVAALALQTFARQDFQTISLMGLGNTARATMACILALYPEKNFTVRLLSYKTHVPQFIEEFQCHSNIRFEEVKTSITSLMEQMPSFPALLMRRASLPKTAVSNQALLLSPYIQRDSKIVICFLTRYLPMIVTMLKISGILSASVNLGK